MENQKQIIKKDKDQMKKYIQNAAETIKRTERDF